MLRSRQRTIIPRMHGSLKPGPAERCGPSIKCPCYDYQCLPNVSTVRGQGMLGTESLEKRENWK